MGRVGWIGVLLFAATAAVGAQQSGDSSFLADQFRRGNPETKIEILRQIADDPAAEVAPVYAAALDYALGALDTVRTDAQYRDLVLETVRRIGEAEYTPALDQLWQLFLAYGDNTVRILTLSVLAEIAQGDAQTILYLNEWLVAQNNLSAGSTTPDLQVVYAAVDAVVLLGDPSSFAPLVDTAVTRHSQRITDRAEQGVVELASTGAVQPPAAVVNASPRDLAARSEYLLGLNELSESFRSEIAAAALSKAVRNLVADADARRYLRTTRTRCARYLRNTGYSEATGAVLTHFNRTVAEYAEEKVSKGVLIDAIRTVGAMGTDAAAARLSDYLEMANTHTEYDRPFDTQLVIETIAALKRIGSQEAYQDVYYVTLLDYPTTIKDAARDALAILRR